jgi:outer membrane protein assembly factor BamB
VTSYIEFPPVIAGERLYVGTDRGRILAVDAATGAVKWMRETGRCIAASAAISRGLVYFALMDPPPCGDQPTSGRLLALRAGTGHTVWNVHAGVMESSPLVVGRTVYVGSWDGRLYAFDASSGRQRWSFQTGGRVKGGAAYAGGTVFVGSYEGHLYALAAPSGNLRWVANVGAPVYTTPAVAQQSVIVGTLRGTVYALGALTGHVDWTRPTGSYVYSSPSIWRGTAYVGSYDRHLYALNLSSGAVRWSFDAGAPVSGTPTVVNGVVYFSRCLGCIAGVGLHLPRRTFGLDATSGRRVWTFPDGEYTPLVADSQRAYLIGYTRIYALEAEDG